MKKTSYSIIGAMAGSSMDGLDLAKVHFSWKDFQWEFRLEECITLPYDQELKERLNKSSSIHSKDLEELDVDFGLWISQKITNLNLDLDKTDLLAIHGHTIIHKPEEGISWQLGNGQVIANECKVATVTDFRTKDIQLGGQGAPLVPFGDFILFKKYDSCINLGGISNISIRKTQTAWDICPCNQVLNYFANKLGHEFDDGGNLSKAGKFDADWYEEILELPYFQQSPPKSLPNNYIKNEILDGIEPHDGLNTYSHLIAKQIGEHLPQGTSNQFLFTGGGAHNSFLTDLIAKEISCSIEVPDKKIIDFKEAIIFGFLGLKSFRKEINVLASVTGASKDSCSGVIHLPI